MSSEKEKTLEEMFSEIETIIDELGNPDMPIEEAFKKYEAGMKELKACNDKIDTIEKKVLAVGDNGELNEF